MNTLRKRIVAFILLLALSVNILSLDTYPGLMLRASAEESTETDSSTLLPETEATEPEKSAEEEPAEEKPAEEEPVEEEPTEEKPAEEEPTEEEPAEEEPAEEEPAEEEPAEEEPAEEEPAEEEPAEEAPVEEEPVEEPFDQTVSLNNTEIRVTADAGVFPAGALLSVSLIEDQKTDRAVKEAVEEIRTEVRRVKNRFAFDIKILLEGREIEPDSTKGSVKVFFSLNQTLKAAMDVEVFHVSESEDGLVAESMDAREVKPVPSGTELSVLREGEASVAAPEIPAESTEPAAETPAESSEPAVESPESPDAAPPVPETPEGEEAESTSIEVETEGFSYFVVEFSYDMVTYVLEGGSTVWLDELLSSLGLPVGSIENVSVSDPNLLLAEYIPDAGRYLLISLRSFQTVERLSFSMNGIPYCLKITDSTANYVVYGNTGTNSFSGKVIGNSNSSTTCTFSSNYSSYTFTGSSTATDKAGITVAEKCSLVLYIPAGVTVTATGGNANGQYGAGAGVYVPKGSTLIVVGGGKLIAHGGNAAAGEAGKDGVSGVSKTKGGCSPSADVGAGNGGKGGNGGGGAGAGIGSGGGDGGRGGAGGEWVRPADSTSSDNRWYVRCSGSSTNHYGNCGENGTPGNNAKEFGALYVLRNVAVEAHGGAANSTQSASGNHGADATASLSSDYYIGGGGGGGGGGYGGGAGADIGSGGGGGCGGGGGGAGCTAWQKSSTPAGAGGTGGSRRTVYSSKEQRNVWLGYGVACGNAGAQAANMAHGGACGAPDEAQSPTGTVTYGEVHTPSGNSTTGTDESGAATSVEADHATYTPIDDKDQTLDYVTVQLIIDNDQDHPFSFRYDGRTTDYELTDEMWPETNPGYVCAGLYIDGKNFEDQYLVFDYNRKQLMSNENIYKYSSYGKLYLRSRSVAAEATYTGVSEDGTALGGYFRYLSEMNSGLTGVINPVVRLMKDCAVNELVIPASRNLTLDLNGYQLSFGSNSAESLILVQTGGSLLLKNSAAGKTSKVKNSRNGNAVAVENHGSFATEGSVALEAVSANEGNGFALLSDNADLTLSAQTTLVGVGSTAGIEKVGAGLALSGGSLSFAALGGASVTGRSKGGVAAAVYVNGGNLSYTGSGAAISAAKEGACNHVVPFFVRAGSLSISGGDFSGGSYTSSLCLWGGSTTISAGSFSTIDIPALQESEVSEPFPAAPGLTISGGSFRTDAAKELIICDRTAVVSVSGGSFVGKLSADYGGSYSLCGGEYSYDVSALCAEGYRCLDCSSGDQTLFRVLREENLVLEAKNEDYNGTEHVGYTISDASSYGYIRARYYLLGDSSGATVQPVHAGRYRVKVTALRMEGKVGYACAAETEFTIAPRTIHAAPLSERSSIFSPEVITITDLPFELTDAQPFATEADANALEVRGTLSLTDYAGAGEYAYDYSGLRVVNRESGEESGDYTVSGDAAARYTVEKATYAVSVQPTLKAATLPYSGKAQTLINGGSAWGKGVMTYAITSEENVIPDSFGSAMTATDAGTYYVYYRTESAEADNRNYRAGEPVSLGSVTITPGKASFDYKKSMYGEVDLEKAGSISVKLDDLGDVAGRKICGFKPNDVTKTHVDTWQFEISYTDLSGKTSVKTYTPADSKGATRLFTLSIREAGEYHVLITATAAKNYVFDATAAEPGVFRREYDVTLTKADAPIRRLLTLFLACTPYGSTLGDVAVSSTDTENGDTLVWEDETQLLVPGRSYTATLMPADESLNPTVITFTAKMGSESTPGTELIIPLTPRTISGTPSDTEPYIEWSNTDFCYDGMGHAPTATIRNRKGTESCTVVVKLQSAGSTALYDTVSEQGSYTAMAVGLKQDDTYYALPANETLQTTFRITEADLSWVYARDVVVDYDGEEHSISVSSVPAGAQIRYSADGVDYSETKPAYCEVGEYTIYYRVTAGTQMVQGSAGLTICGDAGHASFLTDPVPLSDLLEYNGEAQLLLRTLPEPSAGDTVLYAVLSEDQFSGDLSEVVFTGAEPTAIEPGYYRVLCKVRGNGRSDSEIKIYPAVIDARGLSVSWGNTTLLYTGKAQTPTFELEGLVEGDSVQTIISGAISDVGSSTAVLSLDSAEKYYYLDEGSSVTFTIVPATVTVTNPPKAVSKTLISDGETAHVLITAGTVTGGELLYSVNGGAYSSELPAAIESGSYDIAWKHVSRSGNYTVADAAVHTLSKVILRQRIPAAPQPVENLFYTGAAQALITDSQSGMRYSLDGESWVDSPEALTATEPGSYTVYYQALGDGEITADSDVLLLGDTVQIGKCVLDLSLAELSVAEKTYDGSKAVSVTCAKPEITVTGRYEDAHAEENKTVISFNWTITEGYEDHYTLASSLTVSEELEAGAKLRGTILPLTAELCWSGLNPTYTGEKLLPEVTVSNLQSSDSGMKDSCAVTLGEGAESAGTHTVQAEELSNMDYVLPEDASKDYTIEKAESSITVIPTALELHFTNEMQKLVKAGESTDGSLAYSLNGTDWSADIPEARERGEYSVYWRVVGDSNHLDYTAIEPVSVTIGLGELTVTQMSTACTGLVYTGEPLTLMSQGIADHGRFLYSLDGGEYSTELPVATNAGTYRVAVRVESETDYAPLSWDPVEITIERAPVSFTAPEAASPVYNGSEQPLLSEGGSAVGGTIRYEFEGNPTAAPMATDAGTYEILWYVEADANYIGTEKQSLKSTISPKAVDLVWSENSFVYDGSAHCPTASADSSDLCGDDTLSITVQAPVSCTDAGSYTAAALTLSDDNYTFGENSTLRYTIEKAEPGIGTLPEERSWSYDGEKHDLMYTGYSSDGTVLYSLDQNSWQNYPLRATDAGVYTIYYKVVGDRNHTDLPVQTLAETAEITAKELTLSWSVEEFYYNGQAQCPKLTLNGLCDNDICEATVSVSGGDGGAVNAGDYTATVTALSNPNYVLPEDEEERSIDFSIQKANASYAEPMAAEGLVYDGTARKLFTEGSYAGGEMYYRIEGVDEDWTSVSTPVTDAGSYTVYVKLNGGENYQSSDGTDSFTVTITKAASTYATNPGFKSNLIYDGTAQTLVTAGTTSCGTILYSTDDETYTEALPTATNAGSYTVYAKIIGDGNHFDSEGASIGTAVIEKAVPDLGTVSATPVVYGDDISASTISWSSDISGTAAWTETPDLSTLGSREVKADFTPADTVNYRSGELSISVMVMARTAELSWDETTEYTYDGSSHVPGASVQNSVSGDTVTVTVSGAQTDAGSYTATATALSDERYALPTEATKAYSILKAEAAITPPAAATLSFNEDYQELITAGESEQGTFLYTYNSTESEAIPKARHAGEYSVSWRFVGDKNHKDNPGGEITITIEAGASETVIESKPIKNLVYTGKNQALFTAGNVKHGLYEYKLKDGSYSAALPLAVDAGSYEISYYIKGDEDYADSEVKTVTVTIAKAASTYTTNPGIKSNLIYDGTAQTLATAGTTSCGTILYSTDDETYAEVLPTATNAGSYTVYAKIIGDGNHFDSEGASIGTVRISKATPVPGEVKAGDITYGQRLNASEVSYTGAIPGRFRWIRSSSIFAAGKRNEQAVFVPTDSSNYLNVVMLIPVTILPRSVTLQWSPERFAYDEKLHTPEATVTNLAAGDTCTVSVEGGSAGYGEHTAHATALSNGNYTLGENTSFRYRIDLDYTPPKAATNLTANSNKPLVKAGSVPYGTMQYRLTGGEWSDKIPLAEKAGSHTVEYRVLFGETEQARGEIAVKVKEATKQSGSSYATASPSPSPEATAAPSPSTSPTGEAAAAPTPTSESRPTSTPTPTPAPGVETETKKKTLSRLLPLILAGGGTTTVFFIIGKRKKKEDEEEE